jgi:cathepsin C
LLPESYDFRNIDGFDFTNPLRDQGGCGSCYTVSFTQVIESRLKLRYGTKIPVLSPQYLMTCSYLNEGCDGGWSFFHGYLGENGYFVSEKCAPYKHSTKDDKCGNYEKCQPIAKT